MATIHSLKPVIPLARQRGVVVIIFAGFVLGILGILGLAVDLSRLYNRHDELKAAADTTAIAAARQLNGTADSIDKAVAAVQIAAQTLTYDYARSKIAWSSTALTFSARPGGPWLDEGAARADSENMLYARTDTSSLDASGSITTFFLRVLSTDLININTSATSVAARSTIDVVPLAICAMSATPAEERQWSKELVQYGFRRGVGYNLLDLNPNGPDPANFVINPVNLAGQAADLSNTSPSVVGPFVCAGTLPMGTIVGKKIKVSKHFPIDPLFKQLNSRFGDYNGNSCKPESAPPDHNVKSYLFGTANWMGSGVPGGQTATARRRPNSLQTIADPFPSGGNTADYGLLWAFARPVPFSAYKPGKAEPDAGYTPFPKVDWKALYFPGKPEPKPSYPSLTPYDNRWSVNFTPPDTAYGRGVPRRRVLNVPLLDCPIGNGADIDAKVLAIGRFFMTVPATKTSISGEFAGIAAPESLNGTVELY